MQALFSRKNPGVMAIAVTLTLLVALAIYGYFQPIDGFHSWLPPDVLSGLSQLGGAPFMVGAAASSNLALQTQPSTSVRAKNGAKALDVGESTFWRLAQRPDFPKPRKLSARITIWDLGELLAWRDAQQATRAT